MAPSEQLQAVGALRLQLNATSFFAGEELSGTGRLTLDEAVHDSFRDQHGQLPPYPHAFCGALDEPTIDHIVWTCAGAKRAWTTLYQRWTQRSALPTDSELAESAAGIRVPPLGHLTRQAIHEQSPDDRVISRTTRQAWRVACAAVAQSLWLQRNDAVFSRHCPNVFEHEGKALRAASEQLQTLGAHVHRTETLAAGATLTTIAAQLRRMRDIAAANTLAVRLYFDGGSRGNPGSTGAGSILLEQRDAGWTIAWWCFHYLGDTGTNKGAEHEALRRGAVECGRRYSHTAAHITIIGDSQLVLRQVDGTSRTDDRNLLRAVNRTMKTLRAVATFEFRHTLRTGNKMADMLANTAMDTKRTETGPHGTDPTTSTAYDLLDTDVAHQTTPIHQTHDLIDYLKTQLDHHRSLLPHSTRKRSPTTTSPPDNPERVTRQRTHI